MTDVLQSKADKARAAAKIGQQLKGMGVPHDKAAEAAHHELQHGLADQGNGIMGIDVNVSEGKAVPYYQAVGGRTAEEEIKYTEAPTTLSASDKRRIDELRSEIKKTTKKKGLFSWLTGD